MSLPVTPSPKSGFLPPDAALLADVNEVLSLLLTANSPFDDQISNELGRLDLKTSGNGKLAFGSADVVQFGFSGEANTASSLRLKRATGETLGLLDAYLPADLDYNEWLVIAVSSTAKAGVKADGKSKLGAYLALAGGASASGGVGYHACRAYPRRETAKAILTDFISHLRWPLSPPDSVHGLARHDVCATEFRGQLKLWGELGLGYSVSGSKGVSVKDLEATFKYSVQAALRWGGSFELGGEFLVVSSAGEADGWVRLRVRRAHRQDSERHFGFDLKVAYDATGIPTDPAGLLTALAGYDTKNILTWLETVAGATDLDQALKLVTAKCGERAGKSVGALLDGVFRSPTFAKAKTKMDKVLATYSEFKDEIDLRLLDLARQHIHSTEVRQQLETILKLTSREALRGISDAPTWALIDDLYGDYAYALLTDQKAFVAFRQKAQKLDALLKGTGEMRPLREFIEKLEDRFNVDTLVTQLNDGLTPEKLKAIVGGKLGGLTTLLFDIAKQELTGSAVDTLVQRVSGAAQGILALKQKLARSLEQGLKNKLELSIMQSTSRARASTDLVDMEFNLATPTGRTLFDQARRGDFFDAIKGFDPAHVLIRQGAFQEALKTSRTLQIHAFGWTDSFALDVNQVASIETVMQDGGPVFLLSSETAQTLREVSGFDQKETVQSVLQLGFQGRAAAGEVKDNDILVTVLDSMRCTCAVVNEAQHPRWDYLPRAFRLAQQLGLVSQPENVAAALEAEFGPKPPKSVSLKYNVGYNPAAFEALWQRDFESESEDRAFVSQTFRRLLMDRWAFDHPDFFSPETVATYLDHFRIVRLKAGSVKNKRWRYVVESAEGKKITLFQSSDVLYHAYMAETNFLKALEALDDACDQTREGGANWSALNHAVHAFLAVPKEDFAFSKRVWKGNLFFLTLDAMLLQQTGDARAGRTVLQLDLEADDGRKVRRFY